MRLIDANKVAEAITWLDALDFALWHEVQKCIDKQPTVDAKPVRHGHWVKKWNTFFKQDVWHCDVCEKVSPLKYDYCPSCGAKMDRERREDGKT